MTLLAKPPSTVSGRGPTDAALVVAACAGEAWAREALFRRHVDMVNGLAFRLLGRDDELDDVVQDSFTKALGSLSRLRDPQAFSSWLCSIVVKSVQHLLRRRQLLRRLGLRGAPPLDPESLVAPTAPAEVAAELTAVYRIVDALPAGLRVVFLLSRTEGMPQAEIAALVGASVRTIKRRLAKAELLFEDSVLRMREDL